MDDKIEWHPQGTLGPWEAIDCGNGAEWDVVKRDPTTTEGHWYVAQTFDAADGGDAGFNARAIAEVPAMVTALRDVMPILGRAESNASGNPEFDYVGPRVAAVRAILARIDGK